MNIRPALEVDMDSVRDSWARSLRDGAIPSGRTKDVHEHVVSVLARCGAEVLVAEIDLEDGESFLAGWVCHEGAVIHYVFVKLSCRGQGLAKALLAAAGAPGGGAPAICSHYTVGAELAGFSAAGYRPSILLRSKH